MLVPQSCPTLCDLMVCSPPGFSVCGILQARLLEWVGIPFSRGSPWPRDETQVSYTAGRFFAVCTTREAQCQLEIVKDIFTMLVFLGGKYSVFPLKMMLVMGFSQMSFIRWKNLLRFYFVEFFQTLSLYLLIWSSNFCFLFYWYRL